MPLAPEDILCHNLFSIAMKTSTEMDHVPLRRVHKYKPGFPSVPQHYLVHILSIALQLLAIPSMSSMNTRKKNQSAHPGIPDMTPSQRASAGLTKNTTRKKKPTPTQRIAALEEELQAAQDIISRVMNSTFLYLRLIKLTSFCLPEPLQQPCNAQRQYPVDPGHGWRHRPRD